MNKFDLSWKHLKDLQPVFMTELEELASRAADSLAEKRKAAIEYLNVEWCLHPNYQGGKRHSPFNSDRVLVDVQIRAQVAGRI